jgi:hypothetical protein
VSSSSHRASLCFCLLPSVRLLSLSTHLLRPFWPRVSPTVSPLPPPSPLPLLSTVPNSNLDPWDVATTTITRCDSGAPRCFAPPMSPPPPLVTPSPVNPSSRSGQRDGSQGATSHHHLTPPPPPPPRYPPPRMNPSSPPGQSGAAGRGGFSEDFPFSFPKLWYTI